MSENFGAVGPFRNRRFVVEFTCNRCGAKAYEGIDEQKGAERNIQCYRVPDGWIETAHNEFQFCPECSKAFVNFLNESSE